jgi:hypothetical protein
LFKRPITLDLLLRLVLVQQLDQDHKASGSLSVAIALVAKGSNMVANAARLVLEPALVSRRVAAEGERRRLQKNVHFSNPLGGARMATAADSDTPNEEQLKLI